MYLEFLKLPNDCNKTASIVTLTDLFCFIFATCFLWRRIKDAWPIFISLFYIVFIVDVIRFVNKTSEYLTDWLYFGVGCQPVDICHTFPESLLMIPKMNWALQGFTHHRHICFCRLGHLCFNVRTHHLFGTKPLSEPMPVFVNKPIENTF